MLWLLLSAAQAESIDATLRKETVIEVEIVDSTSRYIFWTGDNPLYIEAPDGTWAELDSGYAIVAYATGTYFASPLEDEPPGWDISVSPTGSLDYVYTGLVSSDEWILASDEDFDVQLFAPVPTGASLSPDDSDVRVVSAKADGLQGGEIRLTASAEGDASLPGMSVSAADAQVDTHLPLYLDHPNHYDTGVVDTTAAKLSALSYSDSCGVVSPGTHKLYAELDSSAYGHAALSCDVDQDGDYDLSGEEDVAIIAQLAPGRVELAWEGLDAAGTSALPGDSYDCALFAIYSPVHLQVFGADKADTGVRLFSSTVAGTSLREQHMYWNDALVDAGTNTSLGAPGVAHSGAGGISSIEGSSTSGLLCVDGNRGDCNSHGWGAADEDSRGSAAWIDTWSANTVVELDTFTVKVLDAGDTDGDGLDTPDEHCLLGTDPYVADSDGDGLSDGEEVDAIDSPRNTDGDKWIDALDDDDDNDGILTAKEVSDAAEFGPDVDDDGAFNWHDTDSDNDGILDTDEPGDEDKNDVPDYLEAPQEPGPTVNLDWAAWFAPAAEQPTARGILSGGALLCGTTGAPTGGVLALAAALLVGWRRQKVS